MRTRYGHTESLYLYVIGRHCIVPARWPLAKHSTQRVKYITGGGGVGVTDCSGSVDDQNDHGDVPFVAK